ncbi:MAG: lytic murein transglycosylase [Patescibacteria group bacterium]|nr:lytic murein transglycosylase [Patescibacteria group bacterium]
MNSKYKNNFVINSHKAVLLCGLFLLSFMFLAGMVESAEDSSEEINVEKVNKEKEELKEEIKKVEEKIKKVNTELKSTQQKSRTLKREISIYNNKISKNELEIEETKLIIKESEMEIDEIKKRIEEGEIKKEKYKESLRNLIKLLYIYEQDSVFEVLIARNNLSDFFDGVAAIESVKDEVFESIVNLKNQKEELGLRGKELIEQQEEKDQLIQIRAYQNESLSELKIQNDELLDVTKGEEKQFQQLLAENKNILPSLRAKLYDLQSLGEKIEFDDAFSASEYASSVTGVRQEFILAIFQVETRLGAFEGTGNWEDDMYKCYLRLSKYFPENEAWYINRANKEKNAFFEIVEQLNLDPNSVKLSAEPKSIGCGGAMGFAQFIPSTWLAYKDRVSTITGHYPPSPWNLADSLVTMAVKLSDVPGVIDGNYNAEREAAGRYHGGGKWYKKRSSIKYANKVMIWASLYEEELK